MLAVLTEWVLRYAPPHSPHCRSNPHILLFLHTAHRHAAKSVVCALRALAQTAHRRPPKAAVGGRGARSGANKLTVAQRALDELSKRALVKASEGEALHGEARV